MKNPKPSCTFPAVACLVTLIFVGQVQAFVVGPTGSSSFGGGPSQCPLCDSTVNFAVWENTDGNWQDDAPFVGRVSNLQGNDPGAQYVLLYQVRNTDPLNVANPELENFNVSTTTPNGSPVASQPYDSAGYLRATVFANELVAGNLDNLPNDWVPGATNNPTGFVDDALAVSPSSSQLPSAGSFTIANPAVNGGVGYDGALFGFSPLGTGTIGPGATSAILFLTTTTDNLSDLGIVWGESESPGGFGAAGDIVGVKSIPEPSAFLCLSAVALGLGTVVLRRRFSQA